MILERLAPDAYDAIDGVPDPAENPKLVGHAAAAAMLAGAYRAGKLPHALLLCGPLGIGKATLAFHLAHHLIRHPEARRAPAQLEPPDPASSIFRQVAMGAHPGVLHLSRRANDSGSGFKSVITVEEICRIARLLSLTAHDGGYRVVIVDPAEDMNVNAANALLKNLEEPPARTLFVLISHVSGRLLPTIRSRCQTVLLKPLADAEVADVLAALEVPLPGDSAPALLARAAGSPRAAVLFTHYGGLEITEAVERLAAAANFDIAGCHRLADALSQRDRTVQFDIFNAAVQDSAARTAAHAARAGDLARAGRLSAFWAEALKRTEEARTYNLDKKQHVIGLVEALHRAAQA